ncbi:hypothetical protein [Legionella worsleiensis]|nr:hypothetical protein [Legionella worsleiensis]
MRGNGIHSGLDISFLSCLYGSELKHIELLMPLLFLSCLYGSEPEYQNKK